MPLTKPSTLGELQLYKVLQRANLLSYYEAFISQGGDDVQQLCEAGEEEFLEIMALVEMACKPLHVRRLQKALQEWVTRPAIFRGTNMHYLPAQSISLTSLGIDTNDLIWPPQNSPRNRTSPSLSQDRDGAQSPEEDTPNRPVSTGGSTAATPKSSNGVGNVFRLDEKPGILNGHPSAVDVLDEGESPDDAAVSVFMQTLVQKYIQFPISSMERKDIVAQLQADQSHRDLAAAIGNENRPRMETLARDFIKLERNHEDGTSSRHEVLIVDAAVKLCMSDERWFLKKTELLATAEIIVSEVEAKFPGRRRSATHLHGSCSQSRVQEVNKQLQDLRTQRTNLHKQLQEDQGSKNVIKENECQSILGCIARDEAVLLQEKKALKKKLLLGTKQIPPMSVGMESSFSSDLADLAKAHNLSFGNFQPSTSSWKPMENGVSSSKMTPEPTTTSASPNHTGTITPELLGTSDVKNQGVCKIPNERLLESFR